MSAQPMRSDDQQRREYLFRLFVEQVEDYAIYLLDPEGRVASWNPGARRMEGYRDDEIVGQHFAIFYPAEDVAAGKPWLALETARREGRWEDEGWRIRKDGSRFWAGVVIVAIHDASGQIIGFGKVTRDLTGRRQAEENLHEAIRARDVVLSTVSHDLRGPLASISLMAGALRRIVEEEHPLRRKALVRMLQEIDAQVKRIDDQLAELTDAGRLQSGEPLGLHRQPVDLVALTRRLVGEYQLSTTRHTLRLEDAEPRLDGVWDAPRLERVVGNVLSNAIKYSPDGGQVVVRVRREEADGEHWAVLEVQDSGIGIPAAEIPRVFSWFYRASNVAARVAGSGIGLPSAARIVAQHGGTLDVASQEGQGSTFTLRLPLSDSAGHAGG